MTLYGKMLLALVFCSIQVTCNGREYFPSTPNQPTPTPADLLKELNDLRTDVASFVSGRSDNFIKEFADFVRTAKTKNERLCLSELFATYYSDIAQYLIDGLKETENGKIDRVEEFVESSSPDQIQDMIEEVTAVKNSVADHKATWPSYIEPINHANFQKYQACLKSNSRKP